MTLFATSNVNVCHVKSRLLLAFSESRGHAYLKSWEVWTMQGHLLFFIGGRLVNYTATRKILVCGRRRH